MKYYHTYPHSRSPCTRERHMPYTHRHLLTVSGMSEDPSVSGMYVCMYVGDDASAVNLT
jgi:hypothetical protein